MSQIEDDTLKERLPCSECNFNRCSECLNIVGTFRSKCCKALFEGVIDLEGKKWIICSKCKRKIGLLE